MRSLTGIVDEARRYRAIGTTDGATVRHRWACCAGELCRPVRADSADVIVAVARRSASRSVHRPGMGAVGEIRRTLSTSRTCGPTLPTTTSSGRPTPGCSSPRRSTIPRSMAREPREVGGQATGHEDVTRTTLYFKINLAGGLGGSSGRYDRPPMGFSLRVHARRGGAGDAELRTVGGPSGARANPRRPRAGRLPEPPQAPSRLRRLRHGS